MLESAGQGMLCRRFSNGSVVLLLPHGGRVLGLFAGGSEENFLWTNPALDSEEGTRELFASPEWRNTGGDRTWISPEIDVFFPVFPDLSIARTPDELDSKTYSVEGSAVFVNRLQLRLARSRQPVELEIRKWWDEVEPPVPAGLLDGVQFAGYRQHVTLKAESDTPAAAVSLWNLLQVESGGEAIVPVCMPVSPRVYFGRIAAEDMRREHGQVRYRFGAPGIQKIGLPAHATPGSIGYLRGLPEADELVVRVARVEPLGEYVDVPWTESGELLEPGDAIQLCNVDNELGCFGELEHHAPAGCDDVSELFAFRGPRDAIRRIAATLLG